MGWFDRSGTVLNSAQRWWVAATVLVAVAATCLGLGLSGQKDGLPGPAGRRLSAQASPGAGIRPSPGTASLAVARSVPVELRIPAIGVSVPLSQLGLNPDGTVQVPASFQQPGWYRLGPAPGQPGSAVILGHVDSYLGPAVFFRLRYLHAGDTVSVRLADGVTAHFAVTGIAMYAKARFPDRLVYGSRGYSGLQLVTCGGVFDSETGHYLSNVVVYTRMTGTTRRPATR